MLLVSQQQQKVDQNLKFGCNTQWKDLSEKETREMSLRILFQECETKSTAYDSKII